MICGAGASSTFVALRMRRTISERGLASTVSAASEAELPDALDGIDAVLVGPHLAGRFPEIRAQAAERGVGCALLADTIFTARDGAEALDAAFLAVA